MFIAKFLDMFRICYPIIIAFHEYKLEEIQKVQILLHPKNYI